MKAIYTAILLLVFMGMNSAARNTANHPNETQVDAFPKVTDLSMHELDQAYPNAVGTVKLKVTICSTGKVVAIEVHNSTNAKLNNLAKKLIAERKFEAAVFDGETIESKVIIPVVFI